MCYSKVGDVGANSPSSEQNLVFPGNFQRAAQVGPTAPIAKHMAASQRNQPPNTRWRARLPRALHRLLHGLPL